ncbi:MAG: lipocalin family protein [Verrucomicrobium sp.]
MRFLLLLLPLGLLAAISFTSCASSSPSPPATVASVDLKKYSGKWYEIARYPHSFEKEATKVTATYTPNADGTIEVINRSTKDGKPNDIKGTATPVAGSQGAKLKVKFFTLLPSGNYWVIGLDEKNYQWAMVGEGSRNYFWILSRKPSMDERLYQSLLVKAQGLGYDLSKIEKVPQ